MNTQSDYNSRDSLPEDRHRGKAITPDAKTHTQEDNLSFTQLKDTPSLSRVASRDSNSRPQVVKIQSQVIKVQSRKESKDIVLDLAGANSSFTSGMFPNGQQEIDMSSQRSLADAGLLLMRNISSSSNYQAGLQDLSPKAADLPQIDDLADDKGSELNDSGSYTPTKPLNSKNSATLRISKQPSYKTSNFATTKSTFSAQVTPKARGQREEAKIEDDIDITPSNLITGNFTQINDENDRMEANSRALQGNAIDLEANQPRGNRVMTSSNNNITDNVQAELRPSGAQVHPVVNQNEAPAPANNSNTAATTRTSSNAPPAANQVNPRLQRFYMTEAKIYLTKVSLALFCLLLAAIFTLLISYDKVKIDPLVVTIFCALFFQTLIDVFWTLKVVDQLYLESDEIYNSYDVTAATISLVVTYFKISGLLPISSFACAPLLIITLCYLFFSKADCEDKCLKLGMRIFYTVQVLLITLKLDGKSSWGMVVTMLPSWIAAALYVSKFWILLCTLPKRVFISSNLSVKLRLTGLLWYILLHGLAFVTLVILYGIMGVFDGPKPKYESMRFAAHLTIGFSAGLLVFTILARKRIMRFIVIFGLIKSLIAEDEASKAPTEVRRISFQVERKSNYFVMLSSTYFQPLQKNIKSAGREGFEKFKKMLYNLKMGKANPEQEVPAGGEASVKKGVDLQSLRKDKEHLDVKFAKIETSSGASTPARTRGKQLTFAVQAKTKGVIRDEGDEEKDDNEDNMIKEKARLALSVGDIEEVSKLNDFLRSPKPKDEDENLCHLCYVNAPDAILMGCGHGGICYDCAVTLVKKKDECLECRGKVDAIYRIDPNPKMANIIKAVEINKLVKTTSVV